MPCLTSRFPKQARFSHTMWLRSAFGLCILVGLMLIGSSGVRAETNKQCLATWKKPVAAIKRVSAKPTINNRKTSKQIEIVARKSRYVTPKGYKRLLGLNNATVARNIGISTTYRKQKNGQSCIRLEKVTLEFGLSKTDIYVDRKYRKSSCAYKATLEHENEHTKINQKVIDEYAPLLKRELKERAAEIKPFLTRDPDLAIQSIINRISFDLKPLIEEFSEARQKANDVIDTKQSYRETNRKCRDW